MIFINFVYNTSIGPLCQSNQSYALPAIVNTDSDFPGYSISGELPSSRVRARSIVMGRAVYIICGIITGQIMPRMLNPDAWNLGAKSAFFWLATCFLCSIWCYFRLPETGGFSFSELDILFANKVATRKFTKVKIHGEQRHASGRGLVKSDIPQMRRWRMTSRQALRLTRRSWTTARRFTLKPRTCSGTEALTGGISQSGYPLSLPSREGGSEVITSVVEFFVGHRSGSHHGLPQRREGEEGLKLVWAGCMNRMLNSRERRAN